MVKQNRSFQMIMQSLLGLVVVQSATQAHAAAPRVYFYKIEIKNALNSSTNSTISRFTQALGKSAEYCVDIQSLELAARGDLAERETIGYVSNKPLNPKRIAAIKAALCKPTPPNYDKLPKAPTCSVTMTSKSEPLASIELSLRAEVEDPESTRKTYSLAGLSELPEMSTSCQPATGLEGQHSTWSDAANTPRARAMLTSIVGNVNAFDTVSLKTKGGGWTFGFLSNETKAWVQERDKVRTERRDEKLKANGIKD